MRIISLDRDVPEIWRLGPAVDALRRGELVVLPTDTIYAIGCDPHNARAVGRMYDSKGMDRSKRCALICSNLKDVGQMGRAISDVAFRFMRQHFPGAYTVLLHASTDLPRRAMGKRKTIGIRMPDHPISQALVEDFGRPILVTSLPNPKPGDWLDPVEAVPQLKRPIALVLDQGDAPVEPSTVVDFTVDPPQLIREGKGVVYALE